jgi:threonyl-tRNA synthetase
MELEHVRYYMKPMNCPFHHKIFAARPRSYRDLPVRLAEYGTCYRYEDSGALMGLMRVRSMQMNDAHIYCSEEQFEAEFLAVVDLYLRYFELFGIEEYVMRFSKHAPEGLGKKYVDEPELWLRTEAMTRSALRSGGINFVEVEDEAAFYGPKIDVQITERHRPRVHAGDEPGGLRGARSVRPALHRRAQPAPHAAVPAPGPACRRTSG